MESEVASLVDVLLRVRLRAFGLRNVDSEKLACTRLADIGMSSTAGRQFEFQY